MFRYPGFYTWADTVAKHFSQLSKPQAFGLALWSFGMIIAKSCSPPIQASAETLHRIKEAVTAHQNGPE